MYVCMYVCMYVSKPICRAHRHSALAVLRKQERLHVALEQSKTDDYANYPAESSGVPESRTDNVPLMRAGGGVMSARSYHTSRTFNQSVYLQFSFKSMKLTRRVQSET